MSTLSTQAPYLLGVRRKSEAKAIFDSRLVQFTFSSDILERQNLYQREGYHCAVPALSLIFDVTIDVNGSEDRNFTV